MITNKVLLLELMNEMNSYTEAFPNSHYQRWAKAIASIIENRNWCFRCGHLETDHHSEDEHSSCCMARIYGTGSFHTGEGNMCMCPGFIPH